MVVRDGAGKVIATGALQPGKVDQVVGDIVSPVGGFCGLPFEVKDVPDVPSYTIDVGHGATKTLSVTQLIQRWWVVDFQLGGPATYP